MSFFKKEYNYVRIGRVILKLQDIKDVLMVIAPGASKEKSLPPFNLKIHMKYADNIEIEYETYDERQQVFESLWERMKEL